MMSRQGYLTVSGVFSVKAIILVRGCGFRGSYVIDRSNDYCSYL